MSEKMKHTPGPWTATIDGTGSGRGPVILKDGDFYDDGSTRELAELETSETRFYNARNPTKRNWRRKPNYEEIMANARLIAAAPDLLLVVKRVAGLYEQECRDQPNERRIPYDLGKAAITALANATGVTP